MVVAAFDVGAGCCRLGQIDQRCGKEKVFCLQRLHSGVDELGSQRHAPLDSVFEDFEVERSAGGVMLTVDLKFGNCDQVFDRQLLLFPAIAEFADRGVDVRMCHVADQPGFTEAKYVTVSCRSVVGDSVTDDRALGGSQAKSLLGGRE